MISFVMKAVFLPLALISCVAVAEPFYEPFPYEPGLLPGAGEWTGEEDEGSILVIPGSLKYEGLAASEKNRVKLPPTRSKVIESSCHLERGAPWFSLILRMDTTDGLGAVSEGKGAPFGFFRLATSAGANGPGLYLAPADGGAPGFQLLASKRANPQKIVSADTVLKAGVPHLIVGRYDTTVTPHVLQIWLDPAPDTLAAEEAPEPTASTSNGNDLSDSPDLVILGGGVGSPGVMIDEIRVGESWEEVTPAK